MLDVAVPTAWHDVAQPGCDPLATAEEIASALTWFVAYDKRLADAARSRGLPVVSPT